MRIEIRLKDDKNIRICQLHHKKRILNVISSVLCLFFYIEQIDGWRPKKLTFLHNFLDKIKYTEENI